MNLTQTDTELALKAMDLSPAASYFVMRHFKNVTPLIKKECTKVVASFHSKESAKKYVSRMEQSPSEYMIVNSLLQAVT